VVRTTIVGPFSGTVPDNLGALMIAANGDATPVSCAGLGDLPPGAVVTSVADIGCGPEACSAEVSLLPQSISTGTIAPQSSGPPLLNLPDGCTGEVQLLLEYVGVPDSFLGGNPAHPSWILVRQFTGQGTACPSGTTRCADGFVAQNALVP
jgi:hypothetical protein